VATYLPAYQISVLEDQYGTHPPSYAVDSDQRTNWQFCAVTNVETNPWWMVDLGTPLTVTGVFFTSIDHPGESKRALDMLYIGLL